MWLDLALLVGLIVAVPLAVGGLYVVRVARREGVLRGVANTALALDVLILVGIPVLLVSMSWFRESVPLDLSNAMLIAFWIAIPLAGIIVAVLDMLLMSAVLQARRDLSSRGPTGPAPVSDEA